MHDTDSLFMLGSAFPMGLIQRRVVIEPRSIEDLKRELSNRVARSFWGHDNTVSAASELLGWNVEPENARPAIKLDNDYYPKLDGIVFSECWILAPKYKPGFRPEPSKEIELSDIMGWQVNRMKW